MLRRVVLSLLFALSFAPSATAQETSFAVGQVWSLRDPAFPDARIRIGRIEDGGRTIHISLWGVPAPVPEVTDVIGSPLVAGHLPITAEALRASVGTVSNDQPPAIDFEGGYNAWREAQGGVFTLTVPQIVAAIYETVRNGEPSSAN